MPLEVGDVVIIGRSSATADLVLPSQNVSRQHTEIARLDSGMTIRDMGSRNGTYLGEEKIGEEPSELLCGKSVLIGSYHLFVAGAATAETFRLTDDRSSVEPGIPSAVDYLRAGQRD